MLECQNFTNQKQWKFYLKNLVMTNRKALLKSILLIYDNQTSEEKAIGTSVEDNKIGFSKWDADEMSDIAKKLKQGKELLPNEMIHAKFTMPKYWKQLMIISKRNLEAKKNFDKIQQTNAKRLEILDEMDEIARQCFEEGKSCSYGICDECPYVRSDRV